MTDDEYVIIHRPSSDLFQALPMLWREPHRALLVAHRKHGDIISYRPPGLPPLLLVSDPRVIRHILLEAHLQYTKARLYPLFRIGFGNGLIVSEGREWKEQRRWLQPYMQRRQLGNLVDLVGRVAVRRIEAWRATKNSDINVTREMLAITREVIQAFLVSRDLSDQIEEVRLRFLQGARLSMLGSGMPLPGLSRFTLGLQRLRASFEAEIRSRQRRRDPGNDFLGFMLSSRNSNEPNESNPLVDQLVNMTFAGYETTAQALTWACFLLTQNPGWQARLHEEVDHVLNGQLPGPDEIDRLSIASQITHETLRLFPPAWINGRQAVRTDRFGSLTIPGGAIVVYSAFVVHRHPKYWAEPDSFYPPRFHDGPERYERRFCLLPFGGGARRCIGRDFALLSLKMVLAILAQRFRLLPTSPGPIDIDSGVTLRPRNTVRIKMMPRDTET